MNELTILVPPTKDNNEQYETSLERLARRLQANTSLAIPTETAYQESRRAT
jgi:tRNA A37 threonylcarbamoyladenosine synthetase subunit TsaC/SUA5/YrdC